MPSDQILSATDALEDGVGDQIAAAFTASGEDGDAQVWHAAPRSDTPYPYAVYSGREQPSLLMGNKDDDPVRGVVNVRIHGRDDITVRALGGAVQEALCDNANPPTVTGWRVVWHNLLFHEPLDDIREDAPNIYGRVIEVEYQLDPT